MSGKEHWQQVYSTRAPTSVSWYQSQAGLSLELIKQALPDTQGRIIDVGGGASTLVDGLLQAGYAHVSVLDLSAAALAHARERLAARADAVHWLEGDVTTLALPESGFDLWHDRAVFHFLVEADARAAYRAQLHRALKPGGHLVLATFAPDGPTQCSGLPVRRYSVQGMQDELGPDFRLLEHRDEQHQTPGGNVQHFVYGHFIKSGAEA